MIGGGFRAVYSTIVPISQRTKIMDNIARGARITSRQPLSSLSIAFSFLRALVAPELACAHHLAARRART